MIRWLVENVEEYPLLNQGLAPAGTLTAAEKAQLESFKVPKRRREWLLGRWTAKKLLLSALDSEKRKNLSLSDLSIDNDPSGAPFATTQVPGLENPFCLSISHSGSYAFCAIIEKKDGWIGADIEQVEPRLVGFPGEYFSEVECRMLSGAPDPDLYITAMWSAKEAVLKALRLGLNIDTRWMTCFMTPAPYHFIKWRTFAIELDWSHWDAPYPSGSISGWWRPYKGCVLTLAIYATQPHPQPFSWKQNALPGEGSLLPSPERSQFERSEEG